MASNHGGRGREIYDEIISRVSLETGMRREEVAASLDRILDDMAAVMRQALRSRMVGAGSEAEKLVAQHAVMRHDSVSTTMSYGKRKPN